MTTLTFPLKTDEAHLVEVPRPNTPHWNRYASFALTAVVIVAAIHHAAAPLRSNASWMNYLQDDCFYYLKVAQNLATGHGSTFNGLVLTNGYHPLWLLLLAGFRYMFRGIPFIRFIAFAVAASTVTTYFLARQLLLQARVSPLVRSALAALIAAFSMSLFDTGMEVILTVPLVLAFLLLCLRADLARHGIKHAFASGLLISAMVLSRIDSILLVLLTTAAIALHPRIRRQILRKHIQGLLFGLIPLAIYFAVNHHVFGTWLPVSGMAKQMKTNHLPSFPAWHSLYSGPIRHPISFLPILFALPLIPFLYKRLSDREQIIYPVVLVWPFLYILLLSCLSDWMLWMWYFYPLRLALCVAFILLARSRWIARVVSHPLTAIVLALLAFGKIGTTRWAQGDMPAMVDIATQVQRFAMTHPGIYAMGDRSGSVGYLLPRSLVQTEGLMMDRPFLDKIRIGMPLDTALAPYHVRYYIATEQPPYMPCFHVMEPSQAGPASPHLAGDLCGQPIALFDQGDSRTAIYELAEKNISNNKKP